MRYDYIEQGDCLELLKRIPDNSIDIVVTSPPYDSLRTYNGFTFEFEKIALELYRVIKQGGVIVWIVNDSTINGSESGTSFRQALFFKEIGFNIHDTMIWQKMSPFTHKNRYISDFEYMFVFSKGKPNTTNIICDRKNKYGGSQVHGTERQITGEIKRRSKKQTSKKVKEYGARCNIWNIPGEKNNKTGHPAVFPLQLAKDHIKSWSNEGDIVLDPFLGSGTTAVASIELNRHYIGFEISQEYYEICKKRLSEVGKGRTDGNEQMNIFDFI